MLRNSTAPWRRGSGCDAMKGRVLVIGSLNADVLGVVERFPGRDEAVQMSPAALAPGGHAGNCAVALARLGLNVRVAGAVGIDPLGLLVLDALRAAGVDVGFVTRNERELTGVAFLPILPDGARALYVLRGANRTRIDGDLEAAARGCDLIIVFDPEPYCFEAIAREGRSRTLVFAPGGVAATPSIENLEPLLTAAQFLVVNAPESAALSGAGHPRNAAVRLAKQWRLCVCVTAGADGCWTACQGDESTHTEAFPMNVVDTTGAGDAFTAGFCAGLLDGKAPASAAQFGCAAGALATRALGAQASLGTIAEVDELSRSRIASMAGT